MNIHTCTASEASAKTSAAIPTTGFRSPEGAESGAATVMAPDTDLGVEASGFRCSWTVAWGRTFVPGVDAGTLAVSFLTSAWRGAGATGLTGAAGAEGGAGALGAAGGTGADDGGTVEGGIGGLGAMGGMVAEGGFGNDGTAGRTVADGRTGGTTDPPADGGVGIAGIDGGLGGTGIPGIEPGGFSPAGMTGGGGTAEDPPDTGTGFGGRLIIAVSRGLEAMGEPSRRAGRTILTVSFFGSAIVCSEWVKQQLCCSG